MLDHGGLGGVAAEVLDEAGKMRSHRVLGLGASHSTPVSTPRPKPSKTVVTLWELNMRRICLVTVQRETSIYHPRQ
jgi:hypothetical protein